MKNQVSNLVYKEGLSRVGDRGGFKVTKKEKKGERE